MMLNCFGIDKYDRLHGFMIHNAMLAVCRISRKYYYSPIFKCWQLCINDNQLNNTQVYRCLWNLWNKILRSALCVVLQIFNLSTQKRSSKSFSAIILTYQPETHTTVWGLPGRHVLAHTGIRHQQYSYRVEVTDLY